MDACLVLLLHTKTLYGLYCKFIDVSRLQSLVCRNAAGTAAPAGIIESTEPIADYSAAT